eukprot:TRINITY_DN102644_c0_g1_i1.p1 TRINITY_DN102644_c0_g1~~TRINITY_DN102644_c0_g1_i1.p1  ORF type:complete len:204 (+),score=21.41 TRINITY_DN102644_c0_g1_i1:173-784(+)
MAASRRHQQNKAANRRRSQTAAVSRELRSAKMSEPPTPDIVVTLFCDPSDNEDIVVMGQNISGVEVGRFTVTREDNMLMQDARNLMNAWDCAKAGRLRILTAYGRLIEGQDDAELLTNLLDCGQGQRFSGSENHDDQMEQCSTLSNWGAGVNADSHDEDDDARDECNGFDEKATGDDQMPTVSPCISCKRWLYALVGRGHGLK